MACSSSGKWYLDAPPDWLYPNPHLRPDARLTDDDDDDINIRQDKVRRSRIPALWTHGTKITTRTTIRRTKGSHG